ncbi:hypothetical protein GCM10020221_00030 [Streptomyces thioluteus]|uniref:Uncharacterized protein n=1 Tax=Streptomyces thioluteus TaxID=66431 RepID=A0ABN3WAJ1_STRTU
MAAVAEPVLAALLLGKAAHADERGVELLLTADTHLDDGLLPRPCPPATWSPCSATSSTTPWTRRARGRTTTVPPGRPGSP